MVEKQHFSTTVHALWACKRLSDILILLLNEWVTFYNFNSDCDFTTT